MTDFSGHNLLCFRGERVVFANLAFTLGGGGALVLRGHNGSGKSTLLRLMAGLLKASEGTITWGGESILEEPEQHNARLHYVGHLDAVKSVLTVSENIAFWAELRGGHVDVEAAMETFGIGFLSDVPGRFLSAGQKRRVNLARIAAAPAPLWLLDEPTTALDSGAIAALESAIKTHRASGGMVVASTHADIGLDDATTLNLDDFAFADVAPGAVA
jgi:heme exporter protein A